jgi:hypothetical protein
MMKTEYNYTDDLKIVPKQDDALARLSKLAQDLRDEEASLAELERLTKDNQKRIDALSQSHIPEMMESMGMKEFTTTEGIKIKIDSKLRVSIPKAQMTHAVKWLDEHGYGKLVDRQFTIKFGREDEPWAEKFQRDLNLRKKPLDSSVKQSIHHSRLAKWARTVMEDGVILPDSLFSKFDQKFTKVSLES